MTTATTATTAHPSAAPSPSSLSLGLRRVRIELKTFFRDRNSAVWNFLLPVLLLVIFGSVFGNQDIGPGITFAQYFVAGMIASGVLYTSFQNLAIGIPQERDEGTLKRLEGTPMPKAAYFIGKIGLVAVTYVGQLCVLMIVGRLLYGVHVPATAARWLTLLWVSVLGLISCTLLGLAFSSVPRNGKGASAVVSPIVLLLQFTSGVFFVYSGLPSWMQHFASVFPLKWLAQGMRYVFLPDSAAAVEVSGSFELPKVAMVLAAWSVGGLLLALRFFRWRSRNDG